MKILDKKLNKALHTTKFLLLITLSTAITASAFAQPMNWWPAPYPANSYPAAPYPINNFNTNNNMPPAYLPPRPIYNHRIPNYRPYNSVRPLPPRQIAPIPVTPRPIVPQHMLAPGGYNPNGYVSGTQPMYRPLTPPPSYNQPAYQRYPVHPQNQFARGPFNQRGFFPKPNMDSFPGKDSFFSKGSGGGMPFNRRFYERGPFDKNSWRDDEEDGQFGIFDIIPTEKFGDVWDGLIDGPTDDGDIPGSPIKWPQILMPDPFDVGEQLEDAAYETPSIPLYGTYGTTGNTSGSDDDDDDD